MNGKRNREAQMRLGVRSFKGHRVEIRGFGSFALNYRPPRTGRNPKSGEAVQVPEKYVPHFKAGKDYPQASTYRTGKTVQTTGASSK